jgi:hypothetical protein
MWNHPNPISDGSSRMSDRAVPQWTCGFRHASSATQGRRLPADDPGVRQSRRCGRRSHRSLAQGLPSSRSVARVRSVSRLARTDRKACLLAIEGARIFAPGLTAFHVRGRRPRGCWNGASSGRAIGSTTDETTVERSRGRAPRTLSSGLRIVRYRGFAWGRGRAEIRNFASCHEDAAASRPRFSEGSPRRGPHSASFEIVVRVIRRSLWK